MRRYRLDDLPGIDPESHILAGVVEGTRLYKGGLSFHAPGTVTHNEERPHLETDQEVFCLLQGEGWIEIDGRREPVRAGDVLVIEPGEDHHLQSSIHSPLLNLWLHANDSGNPKQFPESE
ncbi:cupin domain-containing protein [bacterium]|nr:MAG: cupin domain-containing protein [bacterium]